MHHYTRSILLQGVDESHQTTSTITPSRRLAVTVNVYGVCRSMVSFKVCIVLKGKAAYLKIYILWMKTIHYPNTIRSHLVTIIPMAPFTPKSTSKLRSALHFRYSIVIPRLLNPNNHYNYGFHNTFDHNHYLYRDYLVCSVLASAHIIRY